MRLPESLHRRVGKGTSSITDAERELKWNATVPVGVE